MSSHIATIITRTMVMVVVISIILVFLIIETLASIDLCIMCRALRRNLNIKIFANIRVSSSINENGGKCDIMS